MINELIKYFEEKVTLAEEFKEILADFLGDEATSYSIETIPTEHILTKYTDGSSLRQLVFQLASREYYGENAEQNIDNLDFYERFQNEIETNNEKGVLPNIKGIQSIECLNNGTIQDVETGTAKYVIQMRVIYFKDINDNEISL